MAPAVNWTFRARLKRVLDGDTLILDVDTGFAGSREERIRLIGVDTPEVVGVTRAAGLEAAERLRALLHGRQLVVVTEMEKVDGVRRYLGDVWADGLSVTRWLLDEGLAVPWTRR